MKKTSEILRNARRAIIDHGWIQGSFGRPERGFCMVGALNVSFTSEQDIEPYLLARTYIENVVVAGSTPLAHWPYVEDWNDVPGRTKEEVLVVLDEAMKLAESDGK